MLESRLALGSKAALLLSSNPRLPRPYLFLLGFVASTSYLVEQALWSAQTRRSEAQLDAWVVERWVKDGKAVEAAAAVERVLSEGEDEGREAAQRERELVYGVKDAKL